LDSRPTKSSVCLDSRTRDQEAAMAVAVQVEFDGATLEQYDQIIEKMGYQAGGKGAPGCISHWVTKTDKGIKVTDVWEKQQQFESFAQEQIGPNAQSVGVGAPKVTFIDVHNYLTQG
jgi:hypothetical protein